MDYAGIFMEQWREQRPETDTSGMLTVARLTRLNALVSKDLGAAHKQQGLLSWEFDVLATLRRLPSPHRSTMKNLLQVTMISSAAMTHRIDRLVDRGLVQRYENPKSRREAVIELTRSGLDLIDEAIDVHTKQCNDVTAALTVEERKELERLLEKTLVARGDAPPEGRTSIEQDPSAQDALSRLG